MVSIAQFDSRSFSVTYKHNIDRYSRDDIGLNLLAEQSFYFFLREIRQRWHENNSLPCRITQVSSHCEYFMSACICQ